VIATPFQDFFIFFYTKKIQNKKADSYNYLKKRHAPDMRVTLNKKEPCGSVAPSCLG
jgi:hypothetical protein